MMGPYKVSERGSPCYGTYMQVSSNAESLGEGGKGAFCIPFIFGGNSFDTAASKSAPSCSYIATHGRIL